MGSRVQNKKTKRELPFEQRLVFTKLLKAHGPKRKSKNEAEKWKKAYELASKDFEEIYGITPEVVYERKQDIWKND